MEECLLGKLHEYWSRLNGAQWLPRWRDFDPLEVKRLLGNLMVVDVLREPLRFHVRLHGTEMVQRAGYELTGKPLDAIPFEEYRNYVIDRCRTLVANPEPTRVEHSRVLEGSIWPYHALWLPFSDDGKHVSTLLCAI